MGNISVSCFFHSRCILRNAFQGPSECQAAQVTQEPPAPKVQKADVEDAKLDVQVNEMLQCR